MIHEPTCRADAICEGLGASLSPSQENGHLWIVFAASCSLTDIREWYATLEQEVLGLTWGLEKLREHFIGLTVLVQVDHKPLVPLLNDIELDRLPGSI